MKESDRKIRVGDWYEYGPDEYYEILSLEPFQGCWTDGVGEREESLLNREAIEEAVKDERLVFYKNTNKSTHAMDFWNRIKFIGFLLLAPYLIQAQTVISNVHAVETYEDTVKTQEIYEHWSVIEFNPEYVIVNSTFLNEAFLLEKHLYKKTFLFRTPRGEMALIDLGKFRYKGKTARVLRIRFGNKNYIYFYAKPKSKNRR